MMSNFLTIFGQDESEEDLKPRVFSFWPIQTPQEEQDLITGACFITCKFVENFRPGESIRFISTPKSKIVISEMDGCWIAIGSSPDDTEFSLQQLANLMKHAFQFLLGPHWYLCVRCKNDQNRIRMSYDDKASIMSPLLTEYFSRKVRCFLPVYYLPLPKEAVSIILRANEFLESIRKVDGVLAGSVYYGSGVILTQTPVHLTKFCHLRIQKLLSDPVAEHSMVSWVFLSNEGNEALSQESFFKHYDIEPDVHFKLMGVDQKNESEEGEGSIQEDSSDHSTMYSAVSQIIESSHHHSSVPGSASSSSLNMPFRNPSPQRVRLRSVVSMDGNKSPDEITSSLVGLDSNVLKGQFIQLFLFVHENISAAVFVKLNVVNRITIDELLSLSSFHLIPLEVQINEFDVPNLVSESTTPNPVPSMSKQRSKIVDDGSYTLIFQPLVANVATNVRQSNQKGGERENSFCGIVERVHEIYNAFPSIIEVVMRNESGIFVSHQTMGKESFALLPDPPPFPENTEPEHRSITNASQSARVSWKQLLHQ